MEPTFETVIEQPVTPPPTMEEVLEQLEFEEAMEALDEE